MPHSEPKPGRSPAPLSTKRLPLMILGVGCLLGSGVVFIFWPDREAVQGALMRLGIVVFALGYALPRPGEKFRWGGAIAFVIALGLIVPASKRLIPLAATVIVPLLILTVIFRPKHKHPPLR